MSPIYDRVQLFSGGGSRFGYYLGSYAALCEQDLKPDLIMATCGGSLSALLVEIAPEPHQLKQLAQSYELYHVLQAIQAVSLASSKSTRPNFFQNAIRRWYLFNRPKKLAELQTLEMHDQLLAELQHLAMFEVSNENQWLNELMDLKQKAESKISQNRAKENSAPDIAIIASRLIVKESQTDSKSVQLQEVLFASSKVMNYTNQVSQQSTGLNCPTHRYAPNRLLPDIFISNITDAGIEQAVRASMADMYYLTPIQVAKLGWCLGGVIDLTPIELASQLGATVFAETKAGYDTKLAAPAIKRVFGFDPNSRLQVVHDFLHAQQPPQDLSEPQKSTIHWLPFADNGKRLAKMHIRKRLNLRQGNVALIHADYAGFVAQMQAQWDYGYQRTQQYLASL
ncbi:patatin-like phospholipase family protein [uncultured Psychrobacter sp.]|uniref:patatin-like phospholipase family protein n=1 Tax=uncultured Psychrobacter sp. TaxID=259303 RepID=UPI00345756F1